MPKITLMPEGISAAFAGGNASPERRGVVRGLSPGAARRNQQWLMSIDQDKLTGIPVTFTFTLRDVPASSAEWIAAKKALLMRFRRYGVLRLHWVLEWTKRGRPHLHGIAFLPVSRSGVPGHLMRLDGQEIWEVFAPWVFIEYWQKLAGQWGVNPWAQHVQIGRQDNTAWLRYMAKHASRGVRHYQREAEAIPPGWQTTGQMWGKLGSDWPTHSERHELPTWMFHQLRRWIRRRTRSGARSLIETGKLYENSVQVGHGKASLRYLRRLSEISDPTKSARFPISEWIPMELTEAILEGIVLNIRPPAEPHPLDLWEQLKEAHSV